MNFNQQFLNPWFTMNQFYKPNMDNIQYFPEDMLSGLYRQLKIYEDFNKHIQNSNVNLNINNAHANVNAHANYFNVNANANININGNINVDTNINTKN